MTENDAKKSSADGSPPSPSSDAKKNGEHRLYDALRLFLETENVGGASRDQLLVEHPELKDELAPLLESSRGASGGPEPKRGDESSGSNHDSSRGLMEESKRIGAGTVIGDYRIVRRIGEGGMGVVFEAEQLSLRRRVALKVLLGGTNSPRRRARFRREAEAGGRVRHKNIVAVYAVGEHDGISFIAQELVENGLSLAHWIEDHRARGGEGKPDLAWERKIARFFSLAAQAVQAAHDAGIVHRDLKPKNILIGADDEPKVADFGLAWMQAELDISQTGDQVGTPHYMAPEQVDPALGEIDERSDVFSLGAALYEALTLKKPFDGELQAQIFHSILDEDITDPRKIAPSLSRDLAAICLKALAKRPVQRYQTMRAFAEDLKHFLRDEPVSARAPTLLSSGGRFLRRQFSTIVSVVVLGAILTFALRWSDEARKSRDEKHAAIADLTQLLVGQLFQPDVMRVDERFAAAVAQAEAMAKERMADEPELAAEVLLAIGNSALARESVFGDRALARNALLRAADRLADRDVIAAALIALRIERISQEAGDRVEAAAIRADWLKRLESARSGSSGSAQRVKSFFLAQQALADEREGRAGESNRDLLSRSADEFARFGISDAPLPLRRAALEVSGALYEVLGNYDSAAEAFKALFDFPTERPSDEIDRLEWRSRRAFALGVGFRRDPLSHDLIQKNLADRQSLVGNYCVGFYVDELRAAFIEYNLGDTLGVAQTGERVLEHLEKVGRGQSEDELFGLELIGRVSFNASQSATDAERPVALKQAMDDLNRAIDAIRAVRGDNDVAVADLSKDLAEVTRQLNPEGEH